jgi:hypothetical protein
MIEIEKDDNQKKNKWFDFKKKRQRGGAEPFFLS